MLAAVQSSSPGSRTGASSTAVLQPKLNRNRTRSNKIFEEKNIYIYQNRFCGCCESVTMNLSFHFSQTVDANPKGASRHRLEWLNNRVFPFTFVKAWYAHQTSEYAQKGNRKTRRKQTEEPWVAFVVGCPTSSCKFSSCIGNHSKYILSDILHLECNHAMATARTLSEAGRWRKLVSWRVRTA